MRYSSIGDIFSAFGNLKVLILGDVMVDAYLYGDVKRISPEAPVPVVSVRKREKRLGGAANVALNLQALGATPILCSVIGADADGEDFKNLLQAKNISTEGIIESAERVTTIKHRVMSASQHLLRIDSETEQGLSESENQQLREKASQLLSTCDLVVFEDYDKGCLSEPFIQQILYQAAQRNIPTAVDPKKKNFTSYGTCSLFKPNLKELKEGLGIDLEEITLSTIRSAVDQLRKKIALSHVLITLSEKGIYYSNGKADGILPAHLRSIADVSGAGDTVISIAALGMAIGLPIPLLSELANLGGGIVCESLGVVPIDRDRLQTEAEKHDILNNFL